MIPLGVIASAPTAPPPPTFTIHQTAGTATGRTFLFAGYHIGIGVQYAIGQSTTERAYMDTYIPKTTGTPQTLYQSEPVRVLRAWATYQDPQTNVGMGRYTPNPTNGPWMGPLAWAAFDDVKDQAFIDGAFTALLTNLQAR